MLSPIPSAHGVCQVPLCFLSAPYPEDVLKAEAGVVIRVVILVSCSSGMTQFLTGVQIFRCNGFFFSLFVVGVSCRKINLVPVTLL